MIFRYILSNISFQSFGGHASHVALQRFFAFSRLPCDLLLRLSIFLGPYLILLTNRTLVGIIDNEAVYKITDATFIQVSPTPVALSDSQKKQENAFLGELNKLLTDRYFFFSYTFDLSNSLQRRNAMSPEQLSQPLYKRFDNRFFWNRSLVDILISKGEFADWILPILRGKYPKFFRFVVALDSLFSVLIP